jgi:uncharacterized damage-inducible protein DinB
MSAQPTRDQLNPYAKFLEDADPLAVIASTAGEIARLVQGVPEERLERHPAAGKWSIRDIICHLADTELTFAVRLRHTLADAHHHIQPFDQNDWAALSTRQSAAESLAAFTAIRRWDVLFVESATPTDMGKQVTHPERGTMTFRDIIETMAGHDINHLGQIEALRG